MQHPMPFPSGLAVRSAAVLLLLPAMLGAGEGPRGYYRQPSLHAETIVFVAEGDLWTVGAGGGVAHRLTSHPGEERAPAISPDGQRVAFSAAYEGPTEVYTMPLAGGSPTRRTWQAEPSWVVGWTPSGEVIYRSEHFSTLPDPRLVRLDLETGTETLVPLAQASDGAYDDEGNTLFFVRPGFHRNNTRRYQGGTARNIWRFGAGDAEASNLTADFAGEDHSPMVSGARLFFVSERDGTMNLWSMAADGRDLRQHTHHDGWDVRAPSLSEERVVYQLGADLWLHDIASGEDHGLDITLATDLDQLRKHWVHEPLAYLTSWDVDARGERLVLTARGRVFVMPVTRGRRVMVRLKAGVRARDATFMPGGEEILFSSDESGEVELQLVPADGVGSQRAITRDGTTLRFRGLPAPDGKHIASRDKNEDLWLIEVASGKALRVNVGREGIGGFAWSPDSRALAFVETARNTYQQIWIYRLEDGARIAVTSERTNSTDPVWSPDGQWLYFLSDRNLRSLIPGPWGPRQPEPFFDHAIGIFQVALQRGLRPPFRPRDELTPRPETPRASAEASRQEPAAVRVQLDADGLAARLYAVPVPAGNYRHLMTDGKALFWLATDSGPEPETRVMARAIEPESATSAHDEPSVLATKVLDFRLAPAAGKLVLQREKGFAVIDARTGAGSGSGTGGARGARGGDAHEQAVDLTGWSFPISVREDFRQIFLDAWRLERDYFYDPNMHGVDWQAVRDKYLPLVARVTSRAELSDLIGQAVGELSALHVSVRGGDLRTGSDDVEVATLGARLVRDAAAGGYRIEQIYRADPDYPAWRSPLADPYLDLAEGDVIVAINGVALDTVASPAALLLNQAGRQVLLAVRPAAGGEAREVIAVPTRDERSLRYKHWEQGRRHEVERLGAGEIGYLHLQAMGRRNLAEWYRGYYPVFRRRGLIIDVRHNRGGNIDSLILEKLLRRAWFYWQGRVGEPYWNMQYAFRGHMVVLVDERTASDGEAFAEGFRRLGLGPVIGTRTWGGEIWLSNNNRLSDGGLARAPQNGVYGPERAWLIEGHGVVPDIEVDNLPHETFLGRDRQLEAAIELLRQNIAADPRDPPAPPPHPDKSGDS